MSSKRISAVSPNFFNQPDNISELWREFGPFNGRFIQENPSGWIEQCVEKVKSCDFTDLQKMKMFELLNRMRIGGYVINVLGSQRPESEDFRAITSRTESIVRYEFMVDDERSQRRGKFQNWDTVVEKIYENRVFNWTSRGTLRNYHEAVEPLLISAKIIFMVDKYLDPTDKKTESLLVEHILPSLRNKSKCECIHIISSIPNGRPREVGKLKSLMRRYSENIPKGRSIVWHILKEKSHIDLHDRYFVTDLGGIVLGKGFAVSRKRKSNVTISYLSKENHAEQFTLYHDIVKKNIKIVEHSIEVSGAA